MSAVQPKYDFAVIATDVVIFTIREGALQVLLIEMKKPPFTGRFAVPGGLVKPSESVEVAAKHHLSAKAGISNVYLEQLYTFGEVDRDPFGRVVSVAYFALIPSMDVTLRTTPEYAGVAWFPVKKLPKLAYDHARIIKVAVERLQNKLTYTTIAAGLLPREFTLTDLQTVYEVILERPIDKRNFRKKLFALGLVEATGRQSSGGAHRPAALHRFTQRPTQVVDIL